ncbi:hypothetical protein DRN74_00220 [Candidatus Micrarchaeota archaeon]|nr:MAG: hypothetical protein DRN74_00220 [Candidatus Micrarchaeota archaeon]
MDSDQLLFGPWSPIFKGDWTGHPIEILENPEKMVLTVLNFDGEQYVLLNKFLIAEGYVEKLIEEMPGKNSFIFKILPSKKLKIISLSSEIKKAGKDINEKIRDLKAELEKRKELLTSISARYSVNIRELKESPEAAELLFSEPVLSLATLTLKRTEKKGKLGLLGIKSNGQLLYVDRASMRSVALIGELEKMRKCLQVLIENSFLDNLSPMIIDKSDYFERMVSANQSFDSAVFPLSPMGFPIERIKIGDIGISFAVLTAKRLKALLRVKESKSFDIISDIMEKEGDFATLEDLENKIMEINDESQRFHAYRAARWISLIERLYGDLFKKRLEMPPERQITIIDPGNYRKEIVELFLLSLLQESMENRAVFVSNQNFLKTAALREDIIDNIEKTSSCFVFEDEIDIPKRMSEKVTMSIKYVSNNDFAVKDRKKGKFRIRLRDTLSA